MEAQYESKKPKSLLLRLMVNTLSVFATAVLLPKIHIEDFKYLPIGEIKLITLFLLMF